MTGWYLSHIVLVQTTLTVLLLALSIQVPLRAGVFSFAGVGCYGIGGYAAAIAVSRYEMSTFTAIALGTVLAGVAAYLLGLVIQHLTGLYLGMATVAFTLIVSVLAVNGGEFTGGASGVFGAAGNLDTPQILASVVVVVALLAASELGGTGRKVDAVREDPELASALGIDVARYRRAAFGISGLIGGLSGTITILLRSTITPADVNFQLVVLALTVIIVGGARSWLGSLIGSVIFVWLPDMLGFAGDWEAVVYGALVALAAIFLPGGLAGLVVDGYRRIQRARRRALIEPAAAVEPVSETDQQPPPTPASMTVRAESRPDGGLT